MISASPGSSQGYPSLHVISGPQDFIELTLTGADFVGFLVDHDAFRRISVETVKDLMASQVFVDGKWNVYLEIGKGLG